MRFNLKIIIIFILSLFLYAMGSNQGVVTKIPKPDRNFKVKIFDVDENMIVVTDFSVNGLTYLPVQLGKTDISLDFAKIKKVLFYLQDKNIKVKVFFKDGEVSSFFIKKDILFFGRTKWGNLKIKSENLKKIIFIY
ncbi:hypothetical protein [Desulfonauticus submarinus]|uniref:Uncharacterized protein n=1 Tax=Desulfonauticus submarinus TaxID=206665 RepID=A0A1H0DVS9_9BACT|nr:hypothetical protein [Desulfonauticus submarinus]SDN74136.1 hypothetical protein SAMN04488516_10621 [Desulfonauticus submarinus]